MKYAHVCLAAVTALLIQSILHQGSDEDRETKPFTNLKLISVVVSFFICLATSLVPTKVPWAIDFLPVLLCLNIATFVTVLNNEEYCEVEK